MSTGAAIVVVGILAIAAWQIGKHNAWRKAGKFILWGLLALGVVIGAVVGYYQWDEHQEAKADAAEAEVQRTRLKNEGIDTYLGVRLGMSPNEAQYVLGAPSKKNKSGDYVDWRYEGGDSRNRVIFDKTGRLRIISCSGNYSFECPELVGIEIGDSESDILTALGDPISSPEINDDGVKILLYGPRKGRVAFDLAKGMVTKITVVLVEKKAPSESNK